MRSLTYFPVFVLILCRLNGQTPIGSWTDRLSYNRCLNVITSPDKIYASTGSSLIVYNKDLSELKKLSPVNGLSETGISSIGYTDDYKLLIIAYNSSNIDLIEDNNIFTINDISRSLGKRTINRVRIYDRYAYLASDFGIVVIDLIKKEIRDTWKPGPDSNDNEVFDVALSNNRVYAATELGAWMAEIPNQGLAYFGNWKQMDNVPASKCNLSIFCGNKLYLNFAGDLSDGDEVLAVGNTTEKFLRIPGIQNRSFDYYPEGFIISSRSSIMIFNNSGELTKTIDSYGWGIPDIFQAAIENGNIWIADKNYGLIEGRKMTEFSNLSLPGPFSNNVVNITCTSGKTVICAGGTDNSGNGIGRDYQIAVFENGKVNNIVSSNIKDAMRGCVDPSDQTHFFVSSWGYGLFEYRNNTLVNHYDKDNSPLGNDAGTDGKTKISGLAFDEDNNLWIVQKGLKGSIKILKKDGRWLIIPYPVNWDTPGDIISTSGRQKWIIPSGSNSVVVIDNNRTPDLFTDDRYLNLAVRDSDGEYFRAFSIAEDLDGNIWIGTDKGPVIYYNPEKIFEPDRYAFRIKIPRNDGSGLADYMLGTEKITSIAVDGANRKWIGTSGSGAYLLSADGLNVVKAFNTENSPVFADSIASLAVDNKTGEVWFGTSEGVLSLREVATSGGEKFKNVYSFPNPVREDFNGNVTITGLLRDTRIKITDISGNLVFETVSTGGQASWDLTTFNGRRVTTGVYIVFCASNDGSQSYATKILVISR